VSGDGRDRHDGRGTRATGGRRGLARVAFWRRADDAPPGRRVPRLDVPLDARRTLPTPQVDPEAFGRWSERFARWMGTAWFIVGMTVFVVVWLSWNTFMPADLQFDPRDLNYTLLTLLLSLQASYAAPLILLAQNRQADRDRVALEQDRQRAERALADTEYLTREVAALRIALQNVATRDFLRSELRDLLDDLRDDPRDRPRDPRDEQRDEPPAGEARRRARRPEDDPRRSTRTG
jgi:uncharacterized membrane protein